MNPIRGFLLDAWTSGDQITLWVKEKNGNNHFFRDTYHIPVHISILSAKGEIFFRHCIDSHIYSEPMSVVKKELWGGKEIHLYRVRVLNSAEFRRILKGAESSSDHIEYYDTDILAVHRYFLEFDLYPLAYIEIGYGEFGNLFIKTLSERLKRERESIPPLCALLLSTEKGRFLEIGSKNPLLVSLSENEVLKSPQEPQQILEFLNKILLERDPDLIFTHSGDEHLFPTLFFWSQKYGIPLLLDRDPIRVIRKNSIKKKTFFTYGRAIAKTTPFPLFGRLHIDRGVSFFYLESDLEGIFEMSRFSRLSIQKLARSSPGSAMSAMEDETALKMGYAIPRNKGQAPEIKSFSVLLATDQGGLSFRPPVGVFENVFELDFRSLYPNLMRLHNISGETVNCECCQTGGRGVPATPYHTCQKRKGIVGETISLLLDRRDELKKILENPHLSELERKAYTLRASALKWALVTSFGYTGYKHAKYGKREAHESITAHGRFALQRAKEIAEDMGYRFLHGVTDSLWLEGPTDKEKIHTLTKKITEAVGILILHEATYSYIVFPPSKIYGDTSVATRYFAREISGEMKVRGLYIRKRDTPIFIKEFQEKLLKIFSGIDSVTEIQKQESLFHNCLLSEENLLLQRKVPPEKLIIRKYISRPLEEYVQNNSSKIVLQILASENKELIGGERIEYIAISSNHPDPLKRYTPFHLYRGGFDYRFYRDLLRKAYLELTDMFFKDNQYLWG